MYEELDRAHRPPLMQAAKERVSELRGVAADTPAPRRPGPIAGPRRTNPLAVLLVALAGLGAVVALGFMLAPSAAPTAAPTAVYAVQEAAPAPTSPWAPTATPAPTSEPVALPTAEPAPPAVEEAPPAYVPQAAPMAPAPVYAPPAPTADIFANPSDLVPVEEPTARPVFNCPQPTAELDALHCRVQP